MIRAQSGIIGVAFPNFDLHQSEIDSEPPRQIDKMSAAVDPEDPTGRPHMLAQKV
jgi:hypothetical protein